MINACLGWIAPAVDPSGRSVVIGQGEAYGSRSPRIGHLVRTVFAAPKSKSLSGIRLLSKSPFVRCRLLHRPGYTNIPSVRRGSDNSAPELLARVKAERPAIKKTFLSEAQFVPGTTPVPAHIIQVFHKSALSGLLKAPDKKVLILLYGLHG